jgi:hypothetical protein
MNRKDSPLNFVLDLIKNKWENSYLGALQLINFTAK